MDSKHTPGPWEYDPKTQHIYCDDDLGSSVLCSSQKLPGSLGAQLKCNDANMRLAAAAPEMYALLQDMQFEGGHGLRNHERMRAIISKIDQP